MKRLNLFVPALVTLGLAFGAAGCVVHGTARMHTGAYVRPATVYVSPGVYVVEDYHEPVFYSDGWYWRYYGGVWYRSSYHSHGWVRWHNVPRHVAHIHNPHTYVRVRANGRARGHVRDDRPAVRDHRDNRVRPAPRNDRPAVRDHRGATPVRVHKPQPERRDSGTVRDNRDNSKKKSKGPKVRDHR
jgi:hypothetical protein